MLPAATDSDQMSFERQKPRRRLDPNFQPLPTLGRLLLTGLVAGVLTGLVVLLIPGIRIIETSGTSVTESIGTAVMFMWSIAILRFGALWIASHAEPAADSRRRRHAKQKDKPPSNPTNRPIVNDHRDAA